MEQSIGNPILDNSTVSAFRRWRFKPGTPPRVRIPITFVLTGRAVLKYRTSSATALRAMTDRVFRLGR